MRMNQNIHHYHNTSKNNNVIIILWISITILILFSSMNCIKCENNNNNNNIDASINHPNDKSSLFTLPTITSIHSIQETTNNTCTIKNLPNNNCYALLQFYILHYVDNNNNNNNEEETEDNNNIPSLSQKNNKVNMYVYKSKHHSSNLVFPVRLWLNNAPIDHQDPNTLPPNACVSLQLLTPSSNVFEVLPINMNDELQKIHLRLNENPFQVTDRFCTQFLLLKNDCLTLQHTILKLYAHAIRTNILNSCNSIYQLNNNNKLEKTMNSWKLQVYLMKSPRQWKNEVVDFSTNNNNNVNIVHPTSNSIFVIQNDNDYLFREIIHVQLSYDNVKYNNNENMDVDQIKKKMPSSTSSENDIKNNARSDHIRISLDNSLIYFHDHIVDVNLVNVQFSILAIGTHELKVQVGEYNTTTKDMMWLPVIQAVFDIIPSSIYHPTRNSMIKDFQVPSLINDGYDKNNSNMDIDTNQLLDMIQTINRPLKIAYITDIGGLDGQSRVMISTALKLDRNKFHVTFLSTKESKPPLEILDKLRKNDIQYLNIPVKIKGHLYWNVFGGSMQPLLDIVSNIESLNDITNYGVREAIGLMVGMLRGFDIMQITNIKIRQIEDSIVSHLARIANVPIRICDPGNLHENKPSLNGVTDIVVPSYRAKKHWEDMGITKPIHVVWPGATLTNDFMDKKGIDIMPFQCSSSSSSSSSSTDGSCSEEADDNHKDDDISTNDNNNVNTNNNDDDDDPSNIHIAFIGRLHNIKSPGMFIRAASEIKKNASIENYNYKFHIIGDGFLNEPLQTLSLQLGLTSKDIVFHGRFDNNKVLHFLKDKPIHAVVHTSLLNETFGLVLVESMAAKVPVITFGVGGTADFLAIDDKHGYVVSNPDVLNLAKTVLKCIEDNHNNDNTHINNNVGHAAYDVVIDKLNLTDIGMAKRFANLYVKLFHKNNMKQQEEKQHQHTTTATTTTTTTTNNNNNNNNNNNDNITQIIIDHRYYMTPYGRDSEAVWIWNKGLDAWRDESNTYGVHALHPFANTRLRRHRGIPLNECCCGMVCHYVHNNNNNHIWNTYDSLHRNHFLPFLKQRGVEQYQMIRQTKQLVPAYGGSESKKKRLAMMYPKTVGPFPVNVETRGNFLLTSLHKLKHDIEQLEYLLENEKIPNEFEQVIENYTTVYNFELNKKTAKDLDRYIFLSTYQLDLIGTSYNQLLYLPLQTRTSISPTALNPLLNYHAIEEDYFKAEHAPGFTIIDQLLSQEALQKIRQFLLESTIWFDVKEGYLGAYHDEGLNGPLLRQIEEELKFYMPRIFKKEYPLVNMWSYKCDQRYVNGLNVHADAAKVNFNLWLTENDASLDKSNGGLIVYLTPAPPMWDFKQYNALESKPKIYQFIEEQNAKVVKIPFQENRAVVFHSQLFHESDRFKFKKGYKNRRINLTLLFGKHVA